MLKAALRMIALVLMVAVAVSWAASKLYFIADAQAQQQQLALEHADRRRAGQLSQPDKRRPQAARLHLRAAAATASRMNGKNR